MEYRYQGTKWGIWNAMIDRVIKKCLCGNGFWIQGGKGLSETHCAWRSEGCLRGLGGGSEAAI